MKFVEISTPYRQITEVPEYRFCDILMSDRVLDIGANVGAFCIRAAGLSDYVVAVEPVASEVLLENIRINNVNVKVIRGALGDGTPQQVCWDGYCVLSPTYSLRQILIIAGGCDFLKCDCEGAEWQIQPEDLAGVRRIEMELHTPPICKKVNPALLDYIGRHYDFEIEKKPVFDTLGVMGVLHAKRRK